MKKLLSTLLISTVIFGGVQAVAAQDVVGAGDADINISGNLGADNTDPDTLIPETDVDWINVTVPTDTIFYSNGGDTVIKAPKYDIVNNSGRPVKISVKGFSANPSNPTVPGDFNLNLLVDGPATGNAATTPSTELIKSGAPQGPTNELITLANSADQYSKTDPLVPAGTAVKNKATFTFVGSATTTNVVKLKYTLSLRFDAVGF
ncbi:MAG: hypothetical protein WAQ95_00050 [Lactococcus raffinolactis]